MPYLVEYCEAHLGLNFGVSAAGAFNRSLEKSDVIVQAAVLEQMSSQRLRFKGIANNTISSCAPFGYVNDKPCSQRQDLLSSSSTERTTTTVMILPSS